MGTDLSNFKKAFRKFNFIIFGILIPLAFSYYLFWDPIGTRIPIKNEATDDGGVRVYLFPDNISIRHLARQAFQVPLIYRIIIFV